MKRKFKFNIKGFFNRKENIAILAIVVMFGAGLVINNVRSSNIPLHDGDILVDSANVESDEKEKSENNSFEQQRADLDIERNELISKLDDTIENSKNEAEKNNAVKSKETIMGYMKSEMEIEKIISTKNLPESLIIITDNKVTATVDEQDLKQNTVAKICNIIMDETKRGADEIIIQSSY